MVTKDGDALSYDMLVLAIGAHANREWTSEGVLTYHGGSDGPSYRLLLHQLHAGQVTRLAFVKPAGASWPLPLYDLALMTAAECAAHDLSDVELSLITPEDEPLGIFGHPASAAIRRLLDDSGVTLHTSSYGVPSRPGRLDISPGERRLSVDRIVTEPRLVGPRLRGIPAGRDGFIHTDAHGRLVGLDGVFAAGDATAFPIKQGGLAAQQADAVAEMIAASVGVEIDPQPFRPILRGPAADRRTGTVSAQRHQRRGRRRLDHLEHHVVVAARQDRRALPGSLPQQPGGRSRRRDAPARGCDFR